MILGLGQVTYEMSKVVTEGKEVLKKKDASTSQGHDEGAQEFIESSEEPKLEHCEHQNKYSSTGLQLQV